DKCLQLVKSSVLVIFHTFRRIGLISLVVEMRPELLLRDVGACLHEDRSQQASSDGIVVRNGQRLDAPGASAVHFYVLRAGGNHEAEEVENADDVRTRENLK